MCEMQVHVRFYIHNVCGHARIVSKAIHLFFFLFVVLPSGTARGMRFKEKCRFELFIINDQEVQKLSYCHPHPLSFACHPSIHCNPIPIRKTDDRNLLRLDLNNSASAFTEHPLPTLISYSRFHRQIGHAGSLFSTRTSFHLTLSQTPFIRPDQEKIGTD